MQRILYTYINEHVVTALTDRCERFREGKNLCSITQGSELVIPLAHQVGGR